MKRLNIATNKTPNGEDIEKFLNKRIEQTAQDESEIIISPQKLDSETALKEQIREIPTDKVPVILLGGSFNSRSRSTRTKPQLKELVRLLTERLNPDKVCFVIGNRLTVYERELATLAGGKFEIYAIVPTRITPAEWDYTKASPMKSLSADLRL